jgi:release factor glutamine methyltransferase
MTEKLLEKSVYEKLCGVVDPDDASVDARELCRTFSGDALWAAVERRLSGEPLQYIIGEWDFYNCTFRVGEGVLIPRPETELLVDETLEFLKGRSDGEKTVLDLCSGSGCIAISIAKNCPEAKVLAVEKSPAAFEFLKQNIILNQVKVSAFNDDILEGCGHLTKGRFDVIVSNPPYVRKSELETLQTEVLREPVEALDGGEDGLVFYRAIADRWLPLVRPGGLLIVECGEDQAEDVKSIFSAASDGAVYTLDDFAGIHRAVAIKP